MSDPIRRLVRLYFGAVVVMWAEDFTLLWPALLAAGGCRVRCICARPAQDDRILHLCELEDEAASAWDEMIWSEWGTLIHHGEIIRISGWREGGKEEGQADGQEFRSRK